MVLKIENYQSDIFSVITKKKELSEAGYREVFLPKEDELECGEFCLVLPQCEKTGELVDLGNISIFWCKA